MDIAIPAGDRHKERKERKKFHSVIPVPLLFGLH